MESFVSDEEGYEAWLGRNPQGVVMNRKRAGVYMPHRTHCLHVASFGIVSDGQRRISYTKKWGKQCFADEREAATWLRDNSFETVECRTCVLHF